MTRQSDTIKVTDLPLHGRTKFQSLRRIVLWIAAGLTILSPLIFIIAALGAKIGLWGWGFGLGTLTREVGPLVLIATLVAGLIALLLALVVKPRKGIVIAVIAILVPLIAFGRLSSVQKTVAELPFIHDVTTDTEDPPTFGAVIMAERAAVEGVNTTDYAGKTAPTAARDADGKPVMKLVSALQTQSYPEVRTLVLSEPPATVFGRAEQVARSMGWAIKETNIDAGTIQATDTTFWYGFEDDVAIRLRPAKGGGTRVDIRSLSRIGGSDIGKNAARIEAFLAAMKED